jgi:hypothetical protein
MFTPFRRLSYRKDVTFVSIPWVIICVRLDPSTYLRCTWVCPLDLGVTIINSIVSHTIQCVIGWSLIDLCWSVVCWDGWRLISVMFSVSFLVLPYRSFSFIWSVINHCQLTLCLSCTWQTNRILSYFKHRITRVQISDTLYPSDFGDTISYSASACRPDSDYPYPHGYNNSSTISV